MPAPCSSLRGLWADRSGSVVTEAAFALPVLFAMGFATIEIGRGLWMQNSLQDAVESATRCAAVSATCDTDAKIKTYTVSQAIGFQITTSQITVTHPACAVRLKANLPSPATPP